MSKEIDWDFIEGLLGIFDDELPGFEYITARDIENYRWHRLTYGKFPSDLEARLASDKRVLAVLPEIALDPTLSEIAFSLTRGRVAADVIPSHLHADILQHRSDHQIIREALAAREISAEFILALFRMGMMYGAFKATHNLPFDRHKSTVGGQLEGITIQKYWYSHWIVQRENQPTRDDPREAGQRLADLCRRISRGSLDPDSPYPVAWYEAVLSKESRDKDSKEPAELVSGIIRVSGEKLEELRADRVLTRDFLPPLTPAGFSKRCDP